MNGNAGWRFDSELHKTVANFQHNDLDTRVLSVRVSDDNDFRLLP